MTKFVPTNTLSIFGHQNFDGRYPKPKAEFVHDSSRLVTVTACGRSVLVDFGSEEPQIVSRIDAPTLDLATMFFGSIAGSLRTTSDSPAPDIVDISVSEAWDLVSTSVTDIPPWSDPPGPTPSPLPEPMTTTTNSFVSLMAMANAKVAAAQLVDGMMVIPTSAQEVAERRRNDCIDGTAADIEEAQYMDVYGQAPDDADQGLEWYLFTKKGVKAQDLPAAKRAFKAKALEAQQARNNLAAAEARKNATINNPIEYGLFLEGEGVLLEPDFEIEPPNSIDEQLEADKLNRPKVTPSPAPIMEHLRDIGRAVESATSLPYNGSLGIGGATGSNAGVSLKATWPLYGGMPKKTSKSGD